MDESELWVPLVQPRQEEEDELFFPLGPTEEEPPSQVSSEDWLAKMASQTSADPAHAGRFPMRRLWGTVQEVPDFRVVPADRWREAMCTIPERLRLRAVQQINLPLDDAAHLVELALSDLPPAPSDRARATVMADPKLAPTPPRKRVRSADRQVNFRLTQAEYADLATAAELLGYSPGKLARELVRVGIHRVIEEANRPGG